MARRGRQTHDDGEPGTIRRAFGRAWTLAAHLSRKQWLTIVGVIAVLAGARWGLGRMEMTARGLPQCNPTPRLQIVDMPDWAMKEGWTPRLASAVSLDPADNWLDDRLAERIAERFRQSGWVKDVCWVRKYADGSIRVKCDFRRPLGMVKAKEGYIPVDVEGYRLPEVYDRLSPGWIVIEGVNAAPPAVGQKWEGGDLRAGIRLTAMLFDQPWANRISAIDVSNYQGRRDRARHHIVLATQQGTRIRWGSAPGEEIEEPTPAEKIRNIEQQLRIDIGRAWIDVSVYEKKVILPDGANGAVVSVPRVAGGAADR